jgi:hypothetical protein
MYKYFRQLTNCHVCEHIIVFLQKLGTLAHVIPQNNLSASGEIINLMKSSELIEKSRITYSVHTKQPPATNGDAIWIWIIFVNNIFIKTIGLDICSSTRKFNTTKNIT